MRSIAQVFLICSQMIRRLLPFRIFCFLPNISCSDSISVRNGITPTSRHFYSSKQTLIQRFKGGFWQKAGLLFATLLLGSSVVVAQPRMDIRVAASIGSFQNNIDYVLAIGDCTDLLDIQVDVAGTTTTLLPADSRRNPTNPLACEFPFTATGDARFSPEVVIHTSNETYNYSETFTQEAIKPSLTLDGISIDEIEGTQYLNLSLKSADDTDISYVAIDAVGLRASELRRVGGVVEKARETAFAKSPSSQRVWPQADDQLIFNYRLPITDRLSGEEIARNALIMLQATAVDASGNQRTISEVRSVGNSVEENVNGLSVAPQQIVFNDVLQYARLIPSLEYEFRGLTAVPGAGRGVTYSSSDSSTVLVTAEGLVYPLKDGNGTPVTLTVSYSGQADVTIPVNVDFTRQVTGLKYQGQENGPFNLPRLNSYIPLPELLVVFDDGSEAPLNDSLKLNYQLPPVASDIINFEQKSGLKANAVITDAAPVNLHVSLALDANIAVDIPIISSDAAPEVTLDVPAQIAVENTLIFKAGATDDVGIAAVEFWMDGAMLGRRTSLPYELALPISQEMEGRTFSISAVVKDTSGQSAETPVQKVRVVAQQDLTVPNFAFEKPGDALRVVENTPVSLSIASSLGPVTSGKYSSGIKYVEFFFDGRKIGESYYPLLEQRPSEANPKDIQLYEVWKLEATTPSISTRETSLAVSAIVHAKNGGSKKAPDKLIRVLENTRPVVRITSPAAGDIATVGQTIKVRVEVADDTLAAGTTMQLLVNGESIGSRRHQDTVGQDKGVFAYDVWSELYDLEIKQEWLGSSIEFQAEAVDFHQALTKTEIVTLPIKADQLPTIAISHPVEGAQLVSGLPVELRANAADDLGVKQVDFYINDKLIGTDHRAPFALIYETPDNISNELPLAIRAEAQDTAGQKAVSNTVNATLGKDQQPPVVNVSSPEITQTEAGEDVAPVVEDSPFVFKVTGYDNVKVVGLELLGIKKVDGVGFVLTGVETDRIAGSDFPPQEIPGVLNAFSSLKLARAPPFKHLEGVPFDSYPVQVNAVDKAGNTTNVNVIIGVYADQPPVIKTVTANQQRYYNIDTIQLDAVARDDRAVSKIHLNVYVDGETTPTHIAVKDNSNGLVPTPEQVARLEVLLADLGIDNNAHALKLELFAEDETGQKSEAHILNLDVIADSSAPLAAIQQPVQGTTLYTGDTINFALHAVDDTRVKSVTVKSNGQTLFQRSYTGSSLQASVDEVFNYLIPDTADPLVLELTSTDIYDNTSSATLWRYDVGVDSPPQISVRSPAPGSRLIEGESVTVNVLATDDRQVDRVDFFVRTGSTEKIIKTLNRQAIAAAENTGSYLRATLRVPHKPDDGTAVIAGVRAIDSRGQPTEADLQLEILDDEEAPLIILKAPTEPISVFPGQSFKLAGTASDNYYIDTIKAYLIDANGTRIDLDWEIFSRKNRVETIQQPNPGTLGAIIVGQRFYTDFEGRLRLPLSFITDYPGQTLKLHLVAADKGINETATEGLDLTVLEDTEGPVINIIEPATTLYELQPVNLKLTIQDQISVKSYSVRIVDANGRDEVLTTANDLTATNVHVPTGSDPAIAIDISSYQPTIDTPEHFDLIVTAVDHADNSTTETQRYQVLKDQPPVVILKDKVPESSVIYSQLAKGTFEISDDYVTNIDRVWQLPLYTSLTQGSLDRSVTGLTISEQITTDTFINKPAISLNYPEAGSWGGALKINGVDYLLIENGLLELRNYSFSQLNTIALVGSNNFDVSYEITLFSKNACTGSPASKTVSTNGVLNFFEEISSNAAYADLTRAVIRPIYDGAGSEYAPTFIKEIHLSLDEVSPITSYTYDGNKRPLNNHYTISVVLDDQSSGEVKNGFIQSGVYHTQRARVSETGYLLPTLDVKAIQNFSVFAHATDRLSHERENKALLPLAQYLLAVDENGPEVQISSPQQGTVIVPLQNIDIRTGFSDDTGTLKTLRLVENRNNVIREFGIRYEQQELVIPYEVPKEYQAGELELSLIAEDRNGHTSEHSFIYPLHVNEKPQLDLTGFHSYLVDGSYQKNYTDPQRLNYGEFWVRSGETFRLSTELTDDAGLDNMVINRLGPDGLVVEEIFRKDYPYQCPQKPVTHSKVSEGITFDQAQPTEYQIVVTDTYGNQERRTILVHPLTNVVPEIRITSPAQDQDIVAGTFVIKVGVIAADDRFITKQGSKSPNIKIFANGVPLQILQETVFGDQVAGGDAIVNQSFESIYDRFEANYDVEVADLYGHRNSPYAVEAGYVLQVPEGLIRYNEPLTLTAYVYDSDGAVGSSKVTFNVAADLIKPEPIITKPGVGYGAIEDSDFTLGTRAYDNVKVNQLDIYTSYGVLLPNGEYRKLDYTLLRSITGIPSRDYEPVTTVNIDTPEYLNKITTPRLGYVVSQFDNLNITDITRADVWVKVVAFDAANNETREISYPIRVDQRPVIDVVEPLPGARIVEGTKLYVNVQAFDDVGIEYVKLKATYTNGDAPYELRINQGPYNFLVPMPAHNADPAKNIVKLDIEAIDTYGAAHGDLDNHTAFESLSVEVIEDQAPTIEIGVPQTDSDIIEGLSLLVQINAIDDVGVDRVVLNVAGLKGGDRSFTDMTFPFEYLIEVPYGQAGKDLTLTAVATEKRLSGDARSVSTPQPVIVHVLKDDQAPEITVIAPPASGATVAEKRVFPYRIEAKDNVRVNTVSIKFFADKNDDGSFTEGELVESRIMLTPPYSGSQAVKTIAEYIGAQADDPIPDQLAMSLRVTARDGIGNESLVQIPMILVRNQLPEVTDIQVLDARGFFLGQIEEITEGRGIILNVLAKDPEIGVDNATLYYSIGAVDAEPNFVLVGEDAATPFQFHMDVPTGRIGQVLRFAAKARDIDGYESVIWQSPLALTIKADEPPTAKIVKPDNDNSVVINGENVEVFVEVFDDLGPQGVDHVTFYVNGRPVSSVFDNYGSLVGSYAQEHIYRTEIPAPEGVNGFTIQAIAYDKLGQAGESQVVTVGQIEDTVVPKLAVLYPLDKEILTTAEPLRAVASVEDMGGAIESVNMLWQREFQDDQGQWLVVDEYPLELFRDDNRVASDSTPVSEPENHYYIYWADFSDGNILRRDDLRNERLKVTTSVVTPNHTVSQITYYEVGLNTSERRYLAPTADTQNLANQVYYTAVDQYRSLDRKGAMVAAWSTIDPMRIEQGLGNALVQDDTGTAASPPRTGIFIFDAVDETQGNEQGDYYVYSDLLNGAAEIFVGTIGEIKTDENLVFASKSGFTGEGGCDPEVAQTCSFTSSLTGKIQEDWLDGPDGAEGSGALYLDNQNGELLIFNNQNADYQFGLPYQLVGRIDLPYPDAYGLDRKDDLAFVANGYGGIQVLDISNLVAPYHIGFIKPDGFARDVKIKGRFAYIAASHQGVVVADVTDPSMPVVGQTDTLGVANRLHIVGDRLYVTDMSGDGGSSQLTVMDISDPYQPVVVRVIELHPARPDLVSDGVYDVHISGNLAYVTVQYSDQEDQPAQSLVEIIDLERIDEQAFDATVPAIIHRDATALDFAARGITLARGAIQVAAGRKGIDRIDMPALTVFDHQPYRDEVDVNPALESIIIELSAVLPTDTALADYIEILEGDPLIGTPVTDQFVLGYAMRDNDPNYRILTLTRKQDVTLQPNQRYFVRIKAGLAPLTGNTLSSDYVFGFITATAANARHPDITSICTLQSIENTQPCVSRGDINGGTEIVVTGHDFSDKPKLSLGGQPLVIDNVTFDENTGLYQIYAKTVPNYAGPAAVSVTNSYGLTDTVIGGYIYVNQLSVSFINPAVVSVTQAGSNDQVTIVGYGFHSGIEIKAYKSGQPDTAIYDSVNGGLSLYSAERMSWVVPDFRDNDNTSGYRGFIDVELSDSSGRKFVMLNALFYGRLDINRTLVTEDQFTKGDIDKLLNNLDSNVYGYVPDATKLPPGRIVDLDVDNELNFLYVMGRGQLGQNVPPPGSVYSTDIVQHYYAPGWISLVKYDPANLEDAAPRHGLGYFNLPQDLVPTDMVLGTNHLYVLAKGYTFPHIDTPYDGQSTLLVYDREIRDPDDYTEQPPGKDRDVIFSLPLPINEIPLKVVNKDGLLFIAAGTEGVAIVSVAQPTRPTVIRRIESANLSGQTISLNVRDLEIIGDTLHVVHTGSQKTGNTRFTFDITRPTLPQIGTSGYAGLTGVMDAETFATGNGLNLVDANRPEYLRLLGSYQGNGFTVPGDSKGMSTLATTAVNLTREKNPELCKPGMSAYLSVYDASRAQQINLLDALVVKQGCITVPNDSNIKWDWLRDPGLVTDEGLSVFAIEQIRDNGARVSLLNFVDTLTQDLVTSSPVNLATDIHLDAPIELRFTRDITMTPEELAQYIQLFVEDGSGNSSSVGFSISFGLTRRQSD